MPSPDAAVQGFRQATSSQTAIGEPGPQEINTLLTLFNQGQYDEVIPFAQSMTSRFPAHGFGWMVLGAALKLRGRVTEALLPMQKAADLLPGNVDAHHNLGVTLKGLGRLIEAEASYRRVLELKPDYADAHANLGVTLRDQSRPAEAEASLRRALELKPDYADAHSNLGVVLKDQGRLAEAEACLRKALNIRPELTEGHNNLGNTLKQLGRLAEAEASYRKALDIKPDYAEALSNLGITLKEQGRLDEAEACYRRALAIRPNYAEAHSNLGNLLREHERFSAAEACYRRALVIKPGYAEAHSNLGIVLREQGRYAEAEGSYVRALELKPDFAEGHSNLGVLLKDQGRLPEAEASYRRALSLKPGFVEAQSNLLFTLNYRADTAPSVCREEATVYGRMVASQVRTRFHDWTCSAQPERLRVGLVSGDLRTHPVGYFLESLLAHIDPTRIELIAYPTHHQADELTARIKPWFGAWTPLLGLSDEAAAQRIYADGVHVLLDISGHTDRNRLPVFARKPAPVQASWLGYFATTGVAEIDYLLADAVGVPESDRGHFTEAVWYLPETRLCFTRPAADLAVGLLPALENGYITFGCFQNLAKVGDEVLAVWRAILAALPGARLRWQCKQLGDPAVVEQVVQRLQRFGIDAARVALHGAVSRDAYLACHAEIDLILDTFPYPGGTTTCEALWMGVPTLTLAGDRLLSRQGASILAAAGLAHWVAASETDYFEKAIALASDVPKLAVLRADLREQVLASPLFDAPRFARNLEAALWGMWQETHSKNKERR